MVYIFDVRAKRLRRWWPCSLKICFWIFPLPVLGKSSPSESQKICTGALCQPNVCLTKSLKCSTDGSCSDNRGWINAQTTSPYFSSGNPTTLDWIIALCCPNLSSISKGSIFSPPISQVSALTLLVGMVCSRTPNDDIFNASCDTTIAFAIKNRFIARSHPETALVIRLHYFRRLFWVPPISLLELESCDAEFSTHTHWNDIPMMVDYLCFGMGQHLPNRCQSFLNRIIREWHEWCWRRLRHPYQSLVTCSWKGARLLLTICYGRLG